MDPRIWEKRKEYGKTKLSPPFQELLQKTVDPFVSAIRDSQVVAPSSYDRKLLVVGDALCLFRPHVALSTNQAARQALQLYDVMQGRRDWADWERSSLDYAKLTRAMSVAYGEYQFTGAISPEFKTWMNKDPFNRVGGKSSL
jgi:2-polyprenyl-6-methoxyphenol hydroxylase-like FAD-dependent oxidoreductase